MHTISILIMQALFSLLNLSSLKVNIARRKETNQGLLKCFRYFQLIIQQVTYLALVIKETMLNDANPQLIIIYKRIL
jgi:hypothetical protein